MKRTLKILKSGCFVITVIGLALPAVALADFSFGKVFPRGVVEMFAGTNTITPCDLDPAACLGDVTSCGAGESIIKNEGTYSFLEGVCGGRNRPACDGRLTVLQEDCFANPGPGDFNGRLLTATTLGHFRVCFDEQGTGDCTGATPAGVVIAEGNSQCQIRQVFNLNPPGTIPPVVPADVPLSFTCEGDTKRTKRFVIDGRRNRYSLRIFTVEGTAEPDLQNNNCIFTGGCGFAATSVISGPQLGIGYHFGRRHHD